MPYHLVCECGKLNITEEPFCGCKCGRMLRYEIGETMPRPAHEDPPRRINLSLPSSVLAQVELRLIDPITLRAEYGSISKLITALLTRWLADEANKNNADNAVLTTQEKETKA